MSKKSCDVFEFFLQCSTTQWVEGYGGNGLPVAGFSLYPAAGVLGAFGLVESLSFCEEAGVFSPVFLLRGDEAQGAVAVLVVVPLDEVVSPCSCFLKGGEAVGRE